MNDPLESQPRTQYPILIDSCPVCGSKKRLGATLIQELKDDLVLHKDSFSGGFVQQVPLLDQAHPPTIIATSIKIKVVFMYWDVCECGSYYCTKFDCVEMPGQVQMNPPQQQQRRPGGNGLPPLKLN